MISATHLAYLRSLYERTGGKAWTPKDISSPRCAALVEMGFVRIVDGRCGCEIIPKSMLAWTDCAKELLKPGAAEPQNQTPASTGDQQ